jgi:hypothetical protein
MVRIVVVAAALLPILVGCAAPSAHLVNDKGKRLSAVRSVLDCSARSSH